MFDQDHLNRCSRIVLWDFNKAKRVPGSVTAIYLGKRVEQLNLSTRKFKSIEQ